MSSERTAAALTVPQLMSTVKQLTPAELHEFKRQFAVWQQQNGEHAEEDRTLIEACKARLSAVDERRLKRLVAKSERGALGPKELEDYQSLVRRAEALDATRLAALTQLARRWNQPVRVVMDTIDWEACEHATTGHPSRRAKAGAQSRR